MPLSGSLAIVVVVADKGLGRADLDPGPEGGPDPVTDPGQGLLGEIETREAPVPAEAPTGPGSLGVAVATRAVTTTATTTAPGRTTSRRRTLIRTPTEVRILVFPLPLPLWKLGTHPSLLLLLCCFSPLWV